MMLCQTGGLSFARRRLLLLRQTHRLLEYRPAAVILEVDPLGHRVPSATAIPLREFVLGMENIPDLRSIRAAKEPVMSRT